MHRALVPVAILLVATLVPTALADHAYSHRLVVYGRVVDANGNAYPGLTVSATPQGMETEGQCGSQPLTETDAFGPTQTKPVTNDHGEFTFCIHAHTMSRAAPGSIVIRIESQNFMQVVNVDPFLRVHYVPIKLDRATAPNGAPIQDHTVIGRLWRPADTDTTIEGVRVFGDTIDQTPVNITLRYADGREQKANTTTNNYGDFAVRLAPLAPLEGARVIVESSGRAFEADADDDMGATFVKGEYGERPTGRSMTTILVLGTVVVFGAAIAAYSFLRKPSLRKRPSKGAKKRRK